MSLQSLKVKAQKLRSQGKTYSEIAKILKKDIPKSTLSGWCHAVDLPKSYTQKMQRANKVHLDGARRKAIKSKVQKREIFFQEVNSQNKNLAELVRKNKDVQKTVLTILYLAEGSKTARGALMFGNSDPLIVKLFFGLMRRCFEIDESKFRVTVQCRADQNTSLLEIFWSEMTGVPLKQFYKARIDSRTVGKKSKKPFYKGVCRIDYFSSFIDLELKQIAQMILKDDYR